MAEHVLDAHAAYGDGALFAQHGGHGLAQTAQDAVLLAGDDGTALFGRFDDQFLVQRLDGAGEAIYALDPKHMVVKIPMTAEGLKAIKALSAKGIPTNCTLIFSANQALLAARAGATYVSPFLGRLDDISQRGIELIETIHDMFLNYPDIETQIIAASVRNPMHVTDCALAGADIATVPYKVIEQMLHHPLTDSGIEKFKEDYCKVFGE